MGHNILVVVLGRGGISSGTTNDNRLPPPSKTPRRPHLCLSYNFLRELLLFLYTNHYLDLKALLIRGSAKFNLVWFWIWIVTCCFKDHSFVVSAIGIGKW
ncbi:hypothetical protein IMY05_002G0041500 [Salix suchowensis]|nr:hypothetical protein IMY05_002G0041500 [Salix suchowensis]